MEELAKSAKWVRAGAILLFAFGILNIPYPKHDDTAPKAILRVVIGVFAFAVIPIVMKLWPIPGETQVSLRRWSFILGMIFVGDTVIRFRDDFFPQYPSAGEWVVTALFLFGGISVILFFFHDLKKSTERSLPPKKVN